MTILLALSPLFIRLHTSVIRHYEDRWGCQVVNNPLAYSFVLDELKGKQDVSNLSPC